MKINTNILNLGILSLCLIVLINLPVKAQQSSNDSFILDVSYGLTPFIKYNNFPDQHKANARTFAKQMYGFIKQQLDSLAKVKKVRIYPLTEGKVADFRITFSLDFLNGDSQKKTRFTSRLIHQVTGEEMFKQMVTQDIFTEFNDQFFVNYKEFFRAKVITLFGFHILSYHQITDPEIRPDIKARPTLVLHQFTSQKANTQAIALKMNNLTNNALVYWQGRKVTYVKDDPPFCLYDFNYLPKYRVNKQKPTSGKSPVIEVFGQLVEQDAQHYALQLEFKGKDVAMDLYGEPVKTVLTFRKDLLKKGDYTNAMMQIQNNVQLFVLSNFR